MIYGVGTDLIEIKRVERVLARFGERFAQRILCEPELKRFRAHKQPVAYLAKRFAAKEAFTKALGTGIHAPANWHGVWVVNLKSGKPQLEFSDALEETSRAAGHPALAPVPDGREGHRCGHGDPRMRRVKLPLGPVVLDPAGPALTDDDRKRLLHPAAGGVILFAHNYEAPEQLLALTEEISRLREPELPISVDHEGGRVQRFAQGFTPIPPMRQIGVLWDRDRDAARRAARAVGTVIAAELGAHGLDFSFTPVLDLDYGSSAVIGHRAFHFDPAAVGALAAQLIEGLAGGGMAAVGKHFPGHGFAAVDSHVGVPTDGRTRRDLFRKDLVPYQAAIEAGLAAVMPAHVIYTAGGPGTGRLFALLVAGGAARQAGLRGPDLQRRPFDGGREHRGRNPRARPGGAGRGLRPGAAVPEAEGAGTPAGIACFDFRFFSRKN